MISLDVYLHGILTGHLSSDDNDRFSFIYDQEYLRKENAIPLSCSLPLTSEVYPYAVARPFFSGVLPEEESRASVAKTLDISPNNDIKLADAIGGDCAGALSLLRPGMVPRPEGHNISWLSEEQFADALRKLSDRSLLAVGKRVRLSLAGAMCKLTIVHEDNRFGIPDEATPSTHIIKPGYKDLTDLVYNEHFCARLAEKAGLSVAETSVLEHEAGSFLLVKRYDRQDGHRIHQEDFCQALGYAPGDKYQAHGGPCLKECYELVRKHVTTPAPAVNMLTKAVIFNMLIGNNDAHAKNFSLLHHQDGTTTLAPLYDLVCTEMYGDFRNGDMAMKFGGTYSFPWVNASHVESMAKEIKVSYAQLKRLILSMCKSLPEQADACASEAQIPIGFDIAKLVKERAAKLSKRLEIGKTTP